MMGHDLIQKYPQNWKSKLKALQSIDWQKSNPAWEGRAMRNGSLSKARVSLLLTANYLKKQVGLPLAKEEAKLEKTLDGGA